MKCFNHPDVDAVGICKQCNKGICVSCAADLDCGALACKNKHEREVAAVERVISINVRGVDRRPANAFIGSTILLLVGIALLGVGIFGKHGIFRAYSDSAFFVVALGTIFVVYWIYVNVHNYYFFKKIGINQRDKT